LAGLILLAGYGLIRILRLAVAPGQVELEHGEQGDRNGEPDEESGGGGTGEKAELAHACKAGENLTF
jgi:hypothetical protein